MKHKGLGKLVAYSAAAAGFLAIDQEARAEGLYTDIDPDEILLINDTLALDINGDGIDDIGFSIFTINTMISGYTVSGTVIGASLQGSNRVMGVYSSNSNAINASALNAGVVIGNTSTQNFTSGSPVAIGGEVSFAGFPFALGNFNGEDKYMALEINEGGNSFYGWVRLEVNASGNQLTVKEYGFESCDKDFGETADQGNGGPDTAPSASSLVALDGANKGDARDLFLEFDVPADESQIDEYRLIAVKSADAASFTLADAESITVGNYEVVSPSGSSVQHWFKALAADKDGLVIQQNTPYKLFVMSVRNCEEATFSSLAGPSNEVVLSDNTKITELVKLNWIQYNPDELNIKINIEPSNSTIKNTIGIYDLNGRIFKEQEIETFGATVSLRGLSAGIYVAQVMVEGIIYQKKIRVN